VSVQCRVTPSIPAAARTIVAATGTWLLSLGVCAAAASPPAADALKLQPTQSAVDIDRPTPDQVAACTLSTHKDNGQAGWLVKSPDGVVLRWFVDTNGDNVLDRWSYYKDGLEVYRDMDTDFNRRVDQCRWFYAAGTRWGVDANEDGTIDQWRSISAEELSAELVDALVRRDPAKIQPLLLSPADVESLGAGETLLQRLKQRREQTANQLAAFLKSQQAVTEAAKWASFMGSRPWLIPAGTDGAKKDVRLYERALVVVDDAGTFKHLELGTLVQVGDAWRIVDLPRVDSPTDTAQDGHPASLFPAASPATMTGKNSAGDADYQKLLTELAEIDKTGTNPPTEPSAATSAKRADLLEQLAAKSPNSEERVMWTRQLADMLLASVQSGTFSEGMPRLDRLVAQWEKQAEQKDLAAYVSFRRLTAAYAAGLQDEKADPQQVQATRIKSLQAFVDSFPDSEDTPEAMLQLGVSEEFAGQGPQATDWYRKLAERFAKTAPAEKARGALRRLQPAAEPIAFRAGTLSGTSLELKDHRGKLVLLHYWATWSPSSTAQMTALAEVQKQHGLSVLAVIGINMNDRREEASKYVTEQRIAWPQIHEPGGLDGPPADWFGIFSVPTIVLLDREGRVVKHGADISEMEREIRTRTQGNKP
jgi:thiol-disulfide isomerase/thioredoxin